MIRSRDIVFLLTPAIVVAIFAFITIYTQYQPVYEPQLLNNQNQELNFVQIYPQDPILGSLKAPTEIVSFEDMGCSRCQEQMNILNQIIKENPGKLRIIWKSLDVTKFPYSSDTAHSYAYCANKQGKFAEFENEVYKSGNIDDNSLQNYAVSLKLDNAILSDCLKSDEVTQYKKRNEQLAENLGITKVPTIFINNKIVQEPVTLEGWKELLSI